MICARSVSMISKIRYRSEKYCRSCGMRMDFSLTMLSWLNCLNNRASLKVRFANVRDWKIFLHFFIATVSLI